MFVKKCKICIYHQVTSDGMTVDLTPPRITRIADGYKDIDVDFTNIMDCTIMKVEAEDNESPVDHFDVAVLYENDEYLLEPQYLGCPPTGCSVGKVRIHLFDSLYTI